MGRFFSDDANCGRARAWISQEVDGELSPLERILLAAHVRSCADCADFAAELRALASLMRLAAHERPTREFAFPARRRAMPRVSVRVALASALVAAAGALGVLAGSDGGGSHQPGPSPVGDIAFVDTRSADREIKDLRRVELEQPRERVAPPGRLGANA